MDSILNTVSSLWKADLEEYPLGWELRRISHEKPPSPKFWEHTTGDELFSLYKRIYGHNPCYMITVNNKQQLSSVSGGGHQHHYSLARFGTPKEAEHIFRLVQQQLTIILLNCPSIFKESNLKPLLEVFSKNPTYGPAHLLILLNNYSTLHQTWARDWQQVPNEEGIYPVHVACREGKLQCIKELILCECSFVVKDNEGNTCLHYCANSDKNIEIAQLVLKKEPDLLGVVNQLGLTALHEACLHDSIAILKLLRKAGLSLQLPSSKGFPLHLAMCNDSHQCIEYLCQEAPEQLTMIDPNSTAGELPLHMALSDKTISALIEHGSSTEARNDAGKTPLHVMCDKRNLTCVLRLLACDANANALDNAGNTPMHCALMAHRNHSSWMNKDDNAVLDLVRALLVFGGDPNIRNSNGFTVRHFVATKTKDWAILRTLSDVGATRCEKDTKGCLVGCSVFGDFEGDPINPDWMEPDLSGQIKDYIETFDRHTSGVAKSSGVGAADPRRYENIICMDGGGIRGLVTLLCLRELQKHLDHPIRESFDWMAGTSTGGIVTLALALGFSIAKGMGIYFRFKDEVFQGMMRPYDHEPLERLLQEYFGADAVMTDIKSPKVLITSVLGDRIPPDLFFYSNFSPPNTMLTKDLTHSGKFPPTDPPHKQVIWQVARATSAAPTFFAPFGRMIDGGLMCNNPTLDVLTEVSRYQSFYSSNGHSQPKIGCIVSCGTGMVPTEAKSLIINKPSGLMDGIRSVSNLIQLTSTIIDLATISEGRPVAQAQTWCQMSNIPYVRFNPPISTDAAMNETSDSALLKFCWEAQCFINRNKTLFTKVAHYINISRSVSN